MITLTIGKILHDYAHHLTDYEVENLRELQRKRTDFATQVQQLHNILFSEESDFMMDSIADSKDRLRGENPMWVITDVRFNNEAEAIKERGGLLIRVNRPDANSSDTHISETELDEYKGFNLTITNNNLSIEEIDNLISPVIRFL